MNLTELIPKVAKWHHDRNLVHGSTHVKQYIKLAEEMGELANHHGRGQCIKDDIGDMMVVLINICERQRFTIAKCLADNVDDNESVKYDGVDAMVAYLNDETIVNETDPDQMSRVIISVGMLGMNIIYFGCDKDTPLVLGAVVCKLIGMCKHANTTLAECLELAWDEIKDRKGQMIDGVFVKEEDLKNMASKAEADV